MSDSQQHKGLYWSSLVQFYVAAKPRSVFTVFFLMVYGFFVIYYIDNVFLALRYLISIVSGSTALQDSAYLFWGLGFIISLALPFSISLYSLFLLYEVWERSDWSRYAKIAVTALFVSSGLFVIILADDAARFIAKQPAILSFIEDMNLTGRI